VQRAIGQGMQQLFTLNGTEQVSLNYPCTVSCFATSATLSAYGQSIAGGNAENALIGGDFGTNLFQDGTSVGSVSTTITYVADQWAAWGGSTTVITGTQQTGAADIPVSYAASLRINKASGTGGTIPACVLQEISSADSTKFQSQTAEFDFHVKAGAGFSAAGSALNVSIVYGTGTDEGISKLAFAFNGGGGGSSTWAGQANAASNIAVPITTTWTRYTVVAPIPATATELAVVICYTPVGNGGATDWFEFTGAQLVRNPSLTTAAGTSGALLAANAGNARSFARRPASQEMALQEAYYYLIPETNGAYLAAGMVSATNVEVGVLHLPVTMRAVPTCAFTAGGLKWNLAGTNTAVGTLTCNSASTPSIVTIGDTVTATAGGAAFLNGSSTTGRIKVSARF
jgi:hypothetical protein